MTLTQLIIAEKLLRVRSSHLETNTVYDFFSNAPQPNYKIQLSRHVASIWVPRVKILLACHVSPPPTFRNINYFEIKQALNILHSKTKRTHPSSLRSDNYLKHGTLLKVIHFSGFPKANPTNGPNTGHVEVTKTMNTHFSKPSDKTLI